HNRSGHTRWSTTCTITTADPPHEISWVTHLRGANDRTEWRYTLEPTEAGTRVTQTYRVIEHPWWFDRIVRVVTPAHHDRREALRHDLVRLGELAARRHSAPRPDTTDHRPTLENDIRDRFAGRGREAGNGWVDGGEQR